jgi:integrase/recombinase XerD
MDDAVRIERAIDEHLGELARRGRAPKTLRDYERFLFLLAKSLPRDIEVAAITQTDVRRFLDRWRGKGASTVGSIVSCLRGFFRFCELEGYIERTPMQNIERPRRLRPEDLPVVTVSSQDVERMIDGCRDFQELLCLGAAAYLGRRRAALARARRSDADLDRGYITFTDKGGKAIKQPIPDDFLAVLREAEQHGVWTGPDDYLIPNRRRSTTNPKHRSDKIIYETVKRVAARVGVKSHVHALRAAFAVHFIESKPGHLESLKELMGHSRMETVYVYLRRMNKAKAMEVVRDLSWSGLSERAGEAHTGFEPVPEASGVAKPQPSGIRSPGPLQKRLAELRALERGRERAAR